MGISFSSPGTYLIEASGWGLDGNFFVEKTDLLWTSSGEKKLRLHRALPEGVIVFIRLQVAESPNCSVPIAYRVGEVEPMDCAGRCLMKLTQLHPRSKESLKQKNASNEQEGSPREADVLGERGELQREEVLR